MGKEIAEGKVSPRARRLTIAWQNGAWEVVRDDLLDGDRALPDTSSYDESSAGVHWELVDISGQRAYSFGGPDPRIGHYDRVREGGEFEGELFASDFAIIDVLVPDVEGAEFRLHAPDLADSPLPATGERILGLTHVIGVPNG